MARARNIKPGFFKNDLLAECHPLARILFSGLWCEADREGRLEDRPKRLKAEYLPYDDCDADELLDQLASRGFILRYAHGSGRYIAVVEFAKHQNPHMKEAASTIPAPCKHGASTVQATEQHEASPADSLSLDSPSLIPESSSDADASVVVGKPKTPMCPHDAIVSLYHELLPSLTRVRDWTDARQALLRKRWSEDAERQSLEWWRNFFAYVAESDFLTGRTAGRGGEPFECDLEWLVKPRNFIKVIEGRYENRKAA